MKKITLFLLFFWIYGFSQQSEIDKVIKAIKTSEDLLKQIQIDSAYHYAEISQNLAIKINDKNTLALADIAMANVLYKKGKKDEAYTFGKKAEAIAIEINIVETLLKSYLILGNIHFSKFEDPAAITYYQKIEKLAFKSKIENITLVKSIQNSGLLFLRGYEDGLKPPSEQAQFYFKRAYDMAKKINEVDEQHVAGSYLGSIMVEKKDYSEALKLYDAAYSHFKKTTNLKQQTSILWAYASLYKLWGKNEMAEKYYIENILINTIPNNNNGLARAHKVFADYFKQNENYAKAIKEYELSIDLFKKDNTIDVGPYSASLYDLADSYKKTENYKKSQQYLEEYLIYNDSLNAKQNKEAFTEIEAKYQTEKKEQEIQLLSQLTKKQNYIYLSILGLLICLVSFMFYGYQNKIKTAEKLNELNELKSRFFANISHEFRTPLTLIKSPIQSLQSEIQDENQKSKLHLITKNSDRMLNLVDQLLELSKIDSGKLQLILKEGNISSFLHTILESFEFKAKENQQLFTSVIENTTSNHYFDKDVIEKIVTNLLSNAFKYTSEKEAISFSTSIENNQLKLVVANTGTAIKKEELPKLFERFYQKKENQQGVGIGLALVKELVDIYQGKIETAIQSGTLSFTIMLPLEKSKSEAIVITKETHEPFVENTVDNESERPILLIVDDNRDIRTILKELFQDKYQILEADNGETALKIAQKEIPDCIISDVMMPKMDGFQFTTAIKSNELTSFIPIVLLTAKTSDEAHLEGLKSTADAFLTKPFNHDIVKETINQLISERKKLQERYSKELILKPVDVVINSLDEKFLEKLQLILDKELSNSDFTADDFASSMGMSRMQLHRKLKSLLGVSATEFLRKERIKMAASLLKKGNGNISEIAYAVGFNDVSYFIRCFKEMYHCTPSEYL